MASPCCCGFVERRGQQRGWQHRDFSVSPVADLSTNQNRKVSKYYNQVACWLSHRRGLVVAQGAWERDRRGAVSAASVQPLPGRPCALIEQRRAPNDARGVNEARIVSAGGPPYDYPLGKPASKH